MKVLIITEEKGWIMHRMAEEIANHLPGVRINQEYPEADLTYFINYGYYKDNTYPGIKVANFTHFDPDLHGNLFRDVAHSVDHCVAISESTADVLRDFRISDDKISTIIIGADSSFRPKMTLGIVGRTYASGRKGEHILKALLDDPEIMEDLQIVSTSPDWNVPVWEFDSRHDFYRSIDYLLVTATIEGGPVPFMESLACGTPAIAPPVGVIPDFPHIEYPVGDIETLKLRIKTLKQEFLAAKNEVAQHMDPYNWHWWASQHEKLFARLVSNKGE